jgi:hypothetical protein
MMQEAVEHLKKSLNDGGREEMGVPYMSGEIRGIFPKIFEWIGEGIPQRPRQIWFCVPNALEIREQIHPFMRGRILPILPERFSTIVKRQPFDSLLLPEDKNPNEWLRPFWEKRGAYEKSDTWFLPGIHLWFWRVRARPLKFFGLDHHHAVLWDAKQILRPLGVTLDFTWLCDGRPPVNEAVPGEEPPFRRSLDIYNSDPGLPLDPDFRKRILEREYDAVITAHSLVTTLRLRDLGLPMIHINSTRFGNGWILDSGKHQYLVEEIRKLFQENRLKLVHNNWGDQGYVRQFFQGLQPQQEVVCPSLCESILRIRNVSPKPSKYLIWDTRQVLLKGDGSPFMKNLYKSLKGFFVDKIDSQAILLACNKDYLPEGYLDQYTAVIHLPYNISTMSIFQQTRANIPVWVPSPKLLKEIWMDIREPNELSWTSFQSDRNTETWKAPSYLDDIRKEEVIDWWIKRCDFYDEKKMPFVFHFDSIEDLINRLDKTDYDEMMKKKEEEAIDLREDIYATWEQVIQGLREKTLKPVDQN